MSRSDSLVLLASAGTGKTFRLTNRLLALLASDVPARRILASTFTRKAAGEILQRLIVRLCDASSSDAACALLAQQIGVDIDRADAVELCLDLLRHIDRLRVSTLDAWFQERVQLSAFDLGLPANWEICDPALEQRLRARALSRVLDRPRSSLEWSTLIADLKRGGAQAGVHAGLLESLGRAARYARECPPEAWEFPPPVSDVSQEELLRALAEFEALAVPLTKTGGERKSFANARAKLAALVRQGAWSELSAQLLLQRVLDGTLQFDRGTIPEDWAECLSVFAWRCAHHAAAGIRAQNLALRALTADFIQEFDAAMLRERSLSFDALPRLLASQAQPAAAGGEIEHLLLDEFQDTSSLQWRALEPEVERLIARADASFFCVGDVKQSIYGWRDGNPLLLTQLSERLALPSESLSESYRSSQVLLDFVNRVFGSLEANAALASDAARLAGQRFQQSFVPHLAHDLALEGRVRLWRCLPAEGDDSHSGNERARLRRALASAVQLRAARPQGSLAILVRSKKLVPQLLERLKAAGLESSGEGGNPLTDSGAVNVALSLLEFADHPEDGYLWLHLSTSPLAAQFGLEFVATKSARQTKALELRRAWLQLGPAGFLAQLEVGVQEHYGEFDQRRFAQLLALAQTLQPSEALRPARFAQRLAAERVPDPRSSQVQVMTVHGAKGLEFDAVILMDLESVLGKSERGALVARRRGGDPRADFDVVTHTLSAEEARLLPQLQELQTESKSMRIQEELCVLYVALTRAKQQLELVIDDPQENLARDSCAGLLVAALGIEEFQDAGAPAEGPLEPPSDSLPGEAAVSTATVARPGLVPAPARANRAPSTSRPALRESAELFEAQPAARLRGRLWHAWLERIDWIEGELPQPAELLSWARACSALVPEERSVHEFLRALGQPQVRAEFSRSACAQRLGTSVGELRLLREQRFAFLRAGAQGSELVQGAIDRAVVARAQGRAEIIDFKSDALASLDEVALRTRAELYRPQLQLYREALARLEDLQPERIEIRVCFVAVGRSVAL